MFSQGYTYDASGSVVSVDYSADNGTTFTTYYYLRNAQNDVVKLLDSTGATVVQYVYDSWGKLIATTGSLATSLGANQPFRCRGYVYDSETGWYYLQSRYYNPALCRFISADVLLSTGQGVLGHNSFAYCLNNPVNMSDESGNMCRPNVTWYDTWTDDEIAGGVRKPRERSIYGIIICAAYNNTTVNGEGNIEIDISNMPELNVWCEMLGEDRVSELIRDGALKKYDRTYTDQFPASLGGLKREIKDHIGGYLYSQGYRQHLPLNVWVAYNTNRIHDIQQSCAVININVNGANFFEEHLYGYKKGLS